MTDAALHTRAIDVPPIVDLAAFERETEAMAKVPWKSKFGAMFLDQLDAPGPEFEFLIEELLSVGDISVIGGPSQSGKSFLAIHAGMCVATRKPFFGREVKPGLVIYIAGEGARGVKKRLRAWRKHFGVTLGRITPFVLLQTGVNLYAKEGDAKSLNDEIEGLRSQFDVDLAMIVIDTLATASAGADENSFKDVSTVMENVVAIKSRFGCHICLVHHLNAGGTKLRGHTSLFANVDQVILVTRNEQTGVRTAVLDKQKDEESGKRFQFELKSIEIARDALDRPVTSCVCLPVGEKDAIRRSEEVKGFRLSEAEIVFMRALFEAEKKHGLPVPEDLQVPDGVRSVVNYEDVKRAWAAMTPSDAVASDTATPEEIEAAKKRHGETLKKRLQRMREFLTGMKVIGADRGAIYWTGKPLRAFPHTLPREDLAPLEMEGGGLESIPF